MARCLDKSLRLARESIKPFNCMSTVFVAAQAVKLPITLAKQPRENQFLSSNDEIAHSTDKF